MCQKAGSSACFYVSKALGLKNLSCEELTKALLTDKALLPQIVCQGSTLPGTYLFWKNKSSSLQAQACFLSSRESPVFVMFSAANIQ